LDLVKYQNGAGNLMRQKRINVGVQQKKGQKGSGTYDKKYERDDHGSECAQLKIGETTWRTKLGGGKKNVGANSCKKKKEFFDWPGKARVDQHVKTCSKGGEGPICSNNTG